MTTASRCRLSRQMRPCPYPRRACYFGCRPSRGNGNDHVLRRLSFEVAPGQVLGLLGRTGSGKTTLARLLLRLRSHRGPDPSGRPRPDRRRNCRPAPARHAGDPGGTAFQASVRDNLTLFNPAISGCRDRADSRPVEPGRLAPGRCRRGSTQSFASDGGGLSAGQAQLLAFARAFLADPDVVILDEASSRLDPATEQLHRARGRPAPGRQDRHRPPRTVSTQFSAPTES